jgi:ribonuclease P protein component
MRYTFRKQERLTSKSLINRLYKEGISLFQYPFKCSFLEIEIPEDISVQVLIGVSKKRIRTAVKRNLVKRRIREAYRLNKHILTKQLSDKNQKLAIVLNFIADKELSFEEIEKKICLILQSIADQLNQSENK